MYTIYNNSSDQGHNLSSFQENFIAVCEEHVKSGRAMAFAFLLYDFENPHIAKILHDSDYFRALNTISGTHLTVFSIHIREASNAKKKTRKDSNATMSWMNFIDDNRDPSEGYDEIKNRYFKKGEKFSYPAVVFFQVDEGKVSDSVLVTLSENKIEDAFLEIKKYIAAAVKALKKISPENKGNHKEIFQQLAGDVRQVKTYKDLSAKTSSVKSMLDWLLKIAKIAGY